MLGLLLDCTKRTTPYHVLQACGCSHLTVGPTVCSGKMLAAIALPLTWVTCIAVCCGVWENMRQHRVPNMPAIADLDLTFEYTAIGFALSLLLVFKTHTAYARFWEGAPRKQCNVCLLAVCPMPARLSRACPPVHMRIVSRRVLASE